MELIRFDKERGIFHLNNESISYVIKIEEKGLLAHLYFGKAISGYSGGLDYPRFERSFSTNFYGDVNRVYSRDTLLQEYSSIGTGDFRIPSIDITMENGSNLLDFRYESHNIYKGRHSIEVLPHVRVEDEDDVMTLEIMMVDKFNRLKLNLYYTIFRMYDVIIRSSLIENVGEDKVIINKISSLSIDLPISDKEILHLPGSWGNERQVVREKIDRGIFTVDSKRGTSSHQENPFVALVDNNTKSISESALDVY